MNTAQIILLVLVITIITIRACYFIRKRLLIKNYKELLRKIEYLNSLDTQSSLFLCNISGNMPKYFKKHLKKELSKIDTKYSKVCSRRSSMLYQSSKEMVEYNSPMWTYNDIESRRLFINEVIKRL